MSLTAWLVIAVVCVVAGLVLLVLDRRRPRPAEPVPAEIRTAEPVPAPRPAEPDVAAAIPEAPSGTTESQDPHEPGSLFRPNTPDRPKP